MLRLVLIRHAEAQVAQLGQSDSCRDLTARGVLQAQALGLALAKSEIDVDLVLTSTAKRTRRTTEILDFKTVKLVDELYLASAQQIESIIHTYAAQVSSLALVGHNPGLSDFITRLGFAINLDTAQGVLILYDDALVAGVVSEFKVIE